MLIEFVKMIWTFSTKRAIMREERKITSDISLHTNDNIISGLNKEGYRVILENNKINKRQRRIAKET